jgi:hypothetical protein
MSNRVAATRSTAATFVVDSIVPITIDDITDELARTRKLIDDISKEQPDVTVSIEWTEPEER